MNHVRESATGLRDILVQAVDNNRVWFSAEKPAICAIVNELVDCLTRLVNDCDHWRQPGMRGGRDVVHVLTWERLSKLKRDFESSNDYRDWAQQEAEAGEGGAYYERNTLEEVARGWLEGLLYVDEDTEFWEGYPQVREEELQEEQHNWQV